MKASIVASSGAIIPLPFAKAAIVASTPPTVIVRLASFTRVSVVITACGRELDGAAARRGELRAPRRRACATGSRTPMTPVEAPSTVSASDARARSPTAAQTARTSRSPSGPTSAFALPLLATIARIPAAGRRAAPRRAPGPRAPR